MLLNRLFTIIAEQQPEKRQEDKWLRGELTAGAYELNLPCIHAATWISRKKWEKRKKGDDDDDNDEKGGGGRKKEKKSGTVVKASLNAIGVKSQTESRLH